MRLKSNNIELSLFTISLDPYAIDIVIKKGGFDASKLWVTLFGYTLNFRPLVLLVPRFTLMYGLGSFSDNICVGISPLFVKNRILCDTMGYITNMTATSNSTLQVCMQRNRRLVHTNKSRAAYPKNFCFIKVAVASIHVLLPIA